VPDARAINLLRTGVVLEDGPTLPATADIIMVKAGNAILKLGLREGRKRQVRRMCAAVGHPVLALERIAIGPLRLGDLALGKYRTLTHDELQAVKREIERARQAVKGRNGQDYAPDQKR